ncbi:MAG: hypothetical protein ACM3X3_06500 [Betaproteobacteria bacterium]
MTRVAVVPFASPLRDGEVIRQRTAGYVAALKEIGGFEFSPALSASCDGGASQADITLVLALSGGIEAPVLEFLAKCDGPALILAHPTDNAVAAALEIVAFCASSGRRGCIVQARPGWQDELRERLRLFATRARMQGARLGVIGTRDVEVLEPWRLTDQVKRAWGPSLVRVAMEELVEAIRGADQGEVRESAEEFLDSASQVVEPDDGTILGAARIYVGLRDLVRRYKLDAVTVKCFDLLPLLRNTGCYALARLNEEGVPAGCEADVLSTLGMLFVRELTGHPSFMANPSVVDTAASRIVLAHCTIARTMTAGYSVRSHFESGIGVAIQGNVVPGPVTVTRLGGPGLRKTFAACGTVVGSGSREDMCRTQLTVEFGSLEPAARIMSSPLGNHHLVVPGDWEKAVTEYTTMFIDSLG